MSRYFQENYKDFALFFHDSYGGNVIAVLWKPNAYEEQEFKVISIFYESYGFFEFKLLFRLRTLPGKQ